MSDYEGHNKLSLWFGLSYSSFLTIPRVLMEQMSDEWQGQMACLLNEYEEVFWNWPSDYGCRVQFELNGRLAKNPDWIINYRHPNIAEIDKLRGPQ